MAEGYEIRVCTNPTCGLRYPLTLGHPFGERCPICLGTTTVALRREISMEPSQNSNNSFFRLEVLLDNVRSAWNVGAIFRTSDCFGVEKVYLCGITPTPANPSVGKTALGAEAGIEWEYARDALKSAQSILAKGARLWALEQDERAIPVQSDFTCDDRPIVLIVGNEVCGVDPALLDLCERILYIPMLGKKRSLNVEVAYGSALSILRSR